MALTILERPIGVILSTCVDATINEDYNGFATVNKTSHGLSDDNWVYIQGNVENYNGFWKIDVINANEFALKNTDGTYLAYIVDADVTYCPQESTHGFSCVHLPIVYKISNNRYPTNSVDTTRTITGLSNSSNFAQIALSGSLGTFEDLAFVKISNAPNSDLNGIYQVIDKLSTSSVILNVAYSTFTNATIIGASIQLYYGNYNVVVRVYAGLNSSHDWTAEKPYELAATLELIPDEDNMVSFSVNDILKAYVKTENNLLLATLPNNIDAYTNFYISTAEQYDTSNGYTVSTFQTGFTSDLATFEGTAVNSMLEFKNIHSGYLSEYLMTNATAKFLTLFSVPVLFSCSDDNPDCYSDISFINQSSQYVIIKKEYYESGVLQSTENDSLGLIDEGVYRVPVEADCDYDRVDISLITQPQLSTDSDKYSQTGAGASWTGFQTGLITGAGAVSKTKYDQVNMNVGDVITFNYDLFTTHVAYVNGNKAFDIVQLDDNLNVIGVGVSIGIGLGSNIGTSGSMTIVSGMKYIGYFFSRSNFGTETGSFTGLVNGLSIVGASDVILSETKQFDIDCGCSDQEIRLTWLNNLGGFDYWKFTAQTGHSIDITQAIETKKNIFPQWPKSWGENADTIRKQTSRTSTKKEFITSQILGSDLDDAIDKADAISFIKSSQLVQIINSRQDRRTVIVDTDSFVKYTDGDKNITISFNITYTDDLPSQRV